MPGASGSGGPTEVDVPETTYVGVVVADTADKGGLLGLLGLLAAVVADAFWPGRGRVAETRVDDAHATTIAPTPAMARSPASAARQMGNLSACAPRLIRAAI
jgi:hypothetical protein